MVSETHVLQGRVARLYQSHVAPQQWTFVNMIMRAEKKYPVKPCHNSS